MMVAPFYREMWSHGIQAIQLLLWTAEGRLPVHQQPVILMHYQMLKTHFVCSIKSGLLGRFTAAHAVLKSSQAYHRLALDFHHNLQ